MAASAPDPVLVLFHTTLEALLRDTPIEVAEALLDELRDELQAAERTADFFEDRGLPFREAWVGIQFAKLAGYACIRLAPKAQKGYDLTLTKGEERHTFDVTEAMDHSFDRADRYRSGPDTWHEDDEEITRQELLFTKVVGNRLKRKRSPDILVYVNTGWLPDDDEIDATLRRWHDSFSEKFRSAHVLLRRGLVRIAPDFNEVAEWRDRAA